MSIYKLQLDNKLTKEIDKVNGMQKMIHGDNAKIITKKEYLNFIFTNGSQMEKGEILRYFGENLVVKDGVPQIGA